MTYVEGMHAIVVTPEITIPEEALSISFTRSSGPGGQNVNRVASKVRVRVDVDKILGLDDDTKRRLRRMAGHRIDAHGNLLMMSQKTSDQPRNVEDALDKIRRIVLAATITKPERLGSTHTYAAVQKRIDEKKHVAQHRAERAPVEVDPEELAADGVDDEADTLVMQFSGAHDV